MKIEQQLTQGMSRYGTLVVDADVRPETFTRFDGVYCSYSSCLTDE